MITLGYEAQLIVNFLKTAPEAFFSQREIARKAGQKGQFLANPDWVDTRKFGAGRVLAVSPEEPLAANVLAIDGTVIVSDAYPRTRELLEHAGFVTRAVTVTELHKAEAGVTCMSLIVR